MSSPRTSPGIHWLSGAGAPTMPVEAQSMPLPDGTVLTMLVLDTVVNAQPSRNRRGGCASRAWNAGLSVSLAAPRPLPPP